MSLKKNTTNSSKKLNEALEAKAHHLASKTIKHRKMVMKEEEFDKEIEAWKRNDLKVDSQNVSSETNLQ